MSSLVRKLARQRLAVAQPSAFDLERPDTELRRLADSGTVLLLAKGLYALVPEHRRTPSTTWLPTIEGAALGIAAAFYEPDAVALVSPSAVRAHRCYPRALGAVANFPNTSGIQSLQNTLSTRGPSPADKPQSGFSSSSAQSGKPSQQPRLPSSSVMTTYRGSDEIVVGQVWSKSLSSSSERPRSSSTSFDETRLLNVRLLVNERFATATSALARNSRTATGS